MSDSLAAPALPTTAAAAAPRPAGARRSGFDGKITSEQRGAWAGNACATVLFWCLAGALLGALPAEAAAARAVTPLLAAHGALVVYGACMWAFISTHDPTQPSCFSKLLPDSERWTKKTYSSKHKDYVVGIDHWCTWLNTTVCRCNYVPFFTMACAGLLQYAVQFATGALLLLGYRDACGRAFAQPGVYLAAVAVHELGVGAIITCYVTLLYFHVYLCAIDKSTYQWTQDERKAAREARLAAEAEGRVGEENL